MKNHIFVVGEALIDAVQGEKVEEIPGGSPANVAVGVGRLGHEVTLHTWMADDKRGQAIGAHVRESHVHITEESWGGPATSVATAYLDSDGGATYDFDIDLGLAEPHVDLDTYGIVHTGSIASLGEPGSSTILSILHTAAGVRTFDPNIRPSILGDKDNYATRLEQLIECADLVKASAEDVSELGPNLDEIVHTWLTSGPSIVIVTDGGAGVTGYLADGTSIHLDAAATHVADTVGAGDSFMAGIIDALIDLGYTGADGRQAIRGATATELERILHRGRELAAITVSRRGANPPWSHEL